MTEFLAMGGHGTYVWSAYGITLVVLLFSGWAASQRHRRALRDARRVDGRSKPARQPKVTQL